MLRIAVEVELEAAREDDLTLDVETDKAVVLELEVDWKACLVLTAAVDVAPMVFVFVCLPLSALEEKEEEEDAVKEEVKGEEALADIDTSALETAEEASAGRDGVTEALSDATDVLERA